MRSLSMRLFAPVAALVLLSVSQVRAGNITFTYSWTEPVGQEVQADNGTGGHVNFQSLGVQPQITYSTQPFVSLPIASLTTITAAVQGATDTFNNPLNSHYNAGLTITVGGISGGIILGGTLGGSFSLDGGSSITNTFDPLSSATFTGAASQAPGNPQIAGQFILNNVIFTVTAESFSSPGSPGATAGSVGINITAQDAGDGVITKDSPEPSTMVLSLFGLTSLGAGWWRKRRAAAV